MMNEIERDFKEIREAANYRAICAYKSLQEKNPDSDLLKFGRIRKKGRWIFKKEEIEISPEHRAEYFDRYVPGEKQYPLSLDSYASDLEKALRKND